MRCGTIQCRNWPLIIGFIIILLLWNRKVTLCKLCSQVGRVNGYREGSPSSGPGIEWGAPARLLCEHPQQVVPFLRKHRTRRNPVRGRAPRPGRPLREGATLLKQCGSTSRANGQRKGEGRLAPCKNIHNLLFLIALVPYFAKPCARQSPRAWKALTRFFYFDKFWL